MSPGEVRYRVPYNANNNEKVSNSWDDVEDDD